MRISNVNFDESEQTIRKSISKSSFATIDLEMSGVGINEIRILPSTQQRYQYCRNYVMKYTILQLGITLITVNTDETLSKETFTIDVRPDDEGGSADVVFNCDCLKFLLSHNYDINSWVENAIPYHKIKPIVSELLRTKVILGWGLLSDVLFLIHNTFFSLPESVDALTEHIRKLNLAGFMDIQLMLGKGRYVKGLGKVHQDLISSSTTKLFNNSSEQSDGSWHDAGFDSEKTAEVFLMSLEKLRLSPFMISSIIKGNPVIKFLSAQFPDLVWRLYFHTAPEEFAINVKNTVQYDGWTKSHWEYALIVKGSFEAVTVIKRSFSAASLKHLDSKHYILEWDPLDRGKYGIPNSTYLNFKRNHHCPISISDLISKDIVGSGVERELVEAGHSSNDILVMTAQEFMNSVIEYPWESCYLKFKKKPNQPSADNNIKRLKH